MPSVVETLQNFLAQACKEPVSVSSDIVDEFGELCKEAFKKQFTQEREKEFRIRMSNVGKPVRRLWFDNKYKNTHSDSKPSPHTQIKFLYGHMLEELVKLFVII